MTPLALALALALAGDLEPRRLTVHLDLDPAQTTYTGTSTITFLQDAPVSEVIVHAADGMVLTDVAFVRGSRRWPATATPLGEERYAIRPEKKPIRVEGLKIPRKKAAARGEPLYTRPNWIAVEIAFTNEVNDQAFGLYRFEHDGEPYLVSQFEADDAREAFPCIDLPDAKVAFWLDLTTPKDLVALSNGPISHAEVDEVAGTRTVTFQMTRPIPTYAMAVAVGPYESVPIPDLPDGIEGKLWTVRGRTDIARPFAGWIGPLLADQQGWFGSNYPFAKLDFLGVPEFAFGGMENPGLVIFADQFLVPADQLTPGGRRWQRELIAHELAHMWFGDLQPECASA